jgi:hypothetical protein
MGVWRVAEDGWHVLLRGGAHLSVKDEPAVGVRRAILALRLRGRGGRLSVAQRRKSPKINHFFLATRAAGGWQKRARRKHTRRAAPDVPQRLAAAPHAQMCGERRKRGCRGGERLIGLRCA